MLTGKLEKDMMKDLVFFTLKEHDQKRTCYKEKKID